MRIRGTWIRLGLLVALFWLLPLGSIWVNHRVDAGIAIQIGLLLLVFPASTFILSLWDGIKGGRVWLWPIFAGAGFLSTIFVFYNESALIFAVAYAILAIVGAVIGAFLRNRAS